MRTKKPKSVYVQLRDNGKPPKRRNFTVYDTTIDEFFRQVSPLLNTEDSRGRAPRNAPESPQSTQAVA